MDTTVRIETYYTCDCGWSREYTDTSEWKRQRIPHPLYGRISNFGIVQLDTYNHNCYDYLQAVARAPRAHERPVNYEAAESAEETRAAS